ncbi:zinc-binding dehydrogenase [Actinomadura rupiterrae]|uniref:zinc-binding dehydrogenase n=1 Tax=Actinomadura rupiterrae TaxID=559627 RepID=UPI0020A25EED|nr:zinc-binding dehydrogenase [Actinomadura rupiterrae]MCP2339314.1 NADPH:quinone reductase-like Zn-dependent oxidoreductase [Actinomadura rupiterrae]
MRSVVNTPDGTVIREVPDPAPREDEALVAVRAFSINRGELALLARRKQDWRPGQDVAGVVVEAAADGTGPKHGDRVVAIVDEGGWAELAAVPTSRLATVPDAVEMEQAASLPMAGLTALRTLRLGGSVLGRRVLVTGAGGGVGGFQVALAALSGAEVTAVARPDAADRLTRIGAAAVVPDVADATGTFELVLESVGGQELAGAITKIAPDGTVVLLGTSSGEKTGIDIYDFVGGHEGARLLSYLSYAQPQPAGPDLRLLVDLVASGKVKPELGLVKDWTQLPEAITALQDRTIQGKAVLTIT